MVQNHHNKPNLLQSYSVRMGPRKILSSLKIVNELAWQALTSAQQISLMPLATQWNSLSDGQKQKWIAIARNYPNMQLNKQFKLHSRMTEWISLNQQQQQQQRTQARLNFAQSKQLTPTQKTEKWQEYQALSSEEKQKLTLAAGPKHTGAAPAVKPVQPHKLAFVPVTRQRQSTYRKQNHPPLQLIVTHCFR